MREVPAGYKYIGCLNWFYHNPPALYQEYQKNNYPVRTVRLGRSWELYICDELKIAWDVDSSD